MKLRLLVAVLLASQVFAQMKYRFQSNGTAMGAGITMLAQYRWQDAKNERVLIFDSIDVTIRKGRQIESHYRLDRSGWTDFDERGKGTPDKTPVAKKRVAASIGVPQCSVKQESGKLVIKYLADQSNEDNVAKNVLSMVLLCHGPFRGSKEEWECPATLYISEGTSATGNVTYKKESTEGELVTCSLNGSLIAPKVGAGPMAAKNVDYKVTGKAVCSLEEQAWISGEIKTDAKLSIGVGKASITTNATTLIKFERIK